MKYVKIVTPGGTFYTPGEDLDKHQSCLSTMTTLRRQKYHDVQINDEAYLDTSDDDELDSPKDLKQLPAR